MWSWCPLLHTLPCPTVGSKVLVRRLGSSGEPGGASRKEGKVWSSLGARRRDFTLVTHLILTPLKTMNYPVFREEETEAIPR